MRRETKPREAAPLPPVPAAPERGHYVITADDLGLEQWWRIGDMGIIVNGLALATHTKAPIIRRFDPRTLRFRQFSKQTQTPCWKVEE